ncbi:MULTISPECIES: lytic murein transglycosylase [Rhodomicrobium]|uniref:lytic murein transglycosylase n=1 Tax=Rhodomicrobium TaxID=1068 RepID=UPI000B4B6746|nr:MULTISPECIES: lytic murein transglycosylase [Rhodomicrobium]
MRFSLLGIGALAAGLATFAPLPASAVTCNTSESFESWLEGMKRDALAAGVSRRTVSDVLGTVAFDPSIIRRDRAQGVFAQSFLQFSGRMVSGDRMQRGLANIEKYKPVFARIEKEFGVPAPVIVGFWGLETDFGVNSGKSPILGALATLAYDCRRSEMFREQLLAALKIVDHGDLSRDQLVGAWAGELGQTQFLPTHYLEFGVDYDGDGHVDLRNSVPDVLASTAKLIQHYGWKRGEPWLMEVSVPERLPWKEADLGVRHPHAQWAKWGVTLRNGRPLPASDLGASLLLPMGRFGPAFLAYPNFDAYTQWNQSLVYATTAAYYATRLAGAPVYDKGKPNLPTYGLEQTKELQQLLTRHGYEVGKLDGILGAATRDAIRAAQIKFDLPADGYPSDELFARLRGSS